MYFWPELEDFINQRLAAGENTIILDSIVGCGPAEREMEGCLPRDVPPDIFSVPSCGPNCEGCGGGAGVAIAYMVKQDGLDSTTDPFTRIEAQANKLFKARPC